VNPFMEVETFSIPLWESGQGAQFNRINFIVERLYNDFKLTTKTTLRVGKFLAPLNRWNMLHAAPLVWTTNRPVTSRYSFANYITGVQLRHELNIMSGQALEFYWQPDREFDSKPPTHHRRYQGVFGARWILQDDLDIYYALAMQRADVKGSDETRTTWSFDANIQFEFLELSTQLLLTQVAIDQKMAHDNDWGGYLQTVIPIPFNLNILSRYEYFQFAESSVDQHSLLAGITYRPQPDYSFKVEWQQSWGNTSHNPTGLFASIAVMF